MRWPQETGVKLLKRKIAKKNVFGIYILDFYVRHVNDKRKKWKRNRDWKITCHKKPNFYVSASEALICMRYVLEGLTTDSLRDPRAKIK